MSKETTNLGKADSCANIILLFVLSEMLRSVDVFPCVGNGQLVKVKSWSSLKERECSQKVRCLKFSTYLYLNNRCKKILER